MSDWMPIYSVPRDGTVVNLKVNNAPMFDEPLNAAVTLEIQNSWFDEQEECWVYAVNDKVIPLLDMYEPIAWMIPHAA